MKKCYITFLGEDLREGQGTHHSLHGGVEWPGLPGVLTHIRVTQILSKLAKERIYELCRLVKVLCMFLLYMIQDSYCKYL